MKTSFNTNSKRSHIRPVLLLCAALCCAGAARAQVGNTMQNPFVAGTYNAAFVYSNSQNTNPFTNTYMAHPAADIFYRFTLQQTMRVNIQHVQSRCSTLLTLLNSSGTVLAQSGGSLIQRQLAAGTYYVVSENADKYMVSIITTKIEGTPQGITQDATSYSYDAAGNRTGYRKEVVMLSQAASVRSIDPFTNDTTEYGVATGIDDNAAHPQITIFPNPTSGIIHIKLREEIAASRVQARLYAMSGALLRRWKNVSSGDALDIAAQPNGIYILRLHWDGGRESIWKIVKQ